MLRVGLVGYGRRGSVLHTLLRGLADVEISAIGEIDAAAQERARQETGRPVFHPWCESWPTEIPDVVVGGAPARDRAALLEHVVQSGVRAVLVEKPIALTPAEALHMQRVCTAAGATLSVAHHWRFCPALRRLQAIVREGRLGDIESVTASGYGNLLDQGCHLLDAVRWVLGGPAVLWAAAHGTNDREELSRLCGEAAAIEVDPNHPAPLWTAAELALEGDVRMRLETGPLIQQTQAPLGVWHERRFRLQGTRGSAECRPGHYLRLQIPGDDEADMTLHPASLDAATKQLLQSVLDAAQSGSPPPVPANDARQTLEGLLLCGASLRDGHLAIAPLRPRENPFLDVAQSRSFSPRKSATRRAAADGPQFSIVIPLVDIRGHGERCLQGWLGQEGVPPEDYELLLIDDGRAGEQSARLRRGLRAQDRVLSASGGNRSELYHCGAVAARGEYLLLTEAHCVPDPDLLRELQRYLHQHDVDGACCRSIPVCYNDLARADAALFESGFEQFRREDDWRKVNVHGFALRRDVYQLLGGLQSRYDQYAEMVLAADLRDAGVRLGYAAGAAVRHHYRVAARDVAEHLDGFVRGELQYLADHGSTERIGFSFLSVVGRGRESLAALHESAILEWQRLLRDGRHGDFSAIGPLLECLRQELDLRLPGEWWSRWRWARALWDCRRQRRDDARLRAAYERFVVAATELAWRRLHRGISPRQPGGRDLVLSSAALPSDWLYGFYPHESLEGRAFRWTRPTAGIDLPLTAGEYSIEVEIGRIRPWPASLRWTFCGRPIPAAQIEYGETDCRLQITIPEQPVGRRRTLGLNCRPWDVVSDRPLGLPVFEISCRRVDTPAVESAGPAVALSVVDAQRPSAARAA